MYCLNVNAPESESLIEYRFNMNGIRTMKIEKRLVPLTRMLHENKFLFCVYAHAKKVEMLENFKRKGAKIKDE